jgi:hypothetical protein
MTIAQPTLLLTALALVATLASGCCNQFSESLRNADSRNDLIKRLDDSNKECQIKADNTDASTVTYTCENRKVTDIEVELKITACESFLLTGVSRINLIGEDGKLECVSAEGQCTCQPSIDSPL